MMPAPLLKAHQEFDRAVDRCYRPDPFTSDRQGVEYLCTLRENHHTAGRRSEAEEERSITTKLSHAEERHPRRSIATRR